MNRISRSALLLLLAALPAQALEVITLNWREAEPLAEQLRPLLRDGESVSGMDNKLILNASPARSAELRRLVSQLDTRPSSLSIEVEQGQSRTDSSSDIRLGGVIHHDGVSIGSGGGWDGSGIGIGIGGRHGGIVLGGQARQQREQTRSVQMLRVLDRNSAYIALGESRPLPWRIVTPGGAILRGQQYQQAISGFAVRPQRIGGDRVRLELATQANAFDGNAIRGSQLSTSVEGRLGEWITVGGISRDGEQQRILLLGTGQGSQQFESLIRLRINAD